jgi:hypothetical protein
MPFVANKHSTEGQAVLHADDLLEEHLCVIEAVARAAYV